ncbi:hypothetical protein GGR51DRAFT_561666 [Nemania sp. FL0031]|nr:hypothetical protein GGR51DRAFT_561666 [Nemania sp. FL0031]
MDLLPQDSTRAAQQPTRNNEAVVQTTPPPAALQLFRRTALPLYYVERPSVTRHTATHRITVPGPRVPLIPMDQLPTGVEIIGLPRELNREQALSLTSLGVVPKGEPYEVHMPQPQPQPRALPHAPLPLPLPPAPLSSSKTASSRMDPTASPFVSKYLNVFVPVSSSSSDEGRAKGDAVSAGRARKTTVSTRPAMGLHQRPASPTAPETPRENPYPVVIGFVGKRGEMHQKGASHSHPAERLLRAGGEASTSKSKPAPAGRAGNSNNNRPQFTHFSRSSSTSSAQSTGRAKRTNTNTYARQRSPNDSNTKKSRGHPSSARKTKKTAVAKSKVYCRNWCQRGTCRYDEECRYVHEMPVTAQELREVGLVDYPPWWLKNLEMVSQHINKLRATAARHNRYYANDNSSGGGGGGGNNNVQITKDEHHPQQYATTSTSKDRKRSNSWDGTSTSPGPSPSGSVSDWSIAKRPTTSLSTTHKQASSSSSSGTGQQQKTHLQSRTQVQSAEKEYLLPATKMEMQPYHNRHRDRQSNRAPRAQTQAVSTRPPRPAAARTRTPDLFEREIALAATAEQEKWTREQGAKKSRLEGESGPVEGKGGGDEEENLLEI